MQVSSWKASNFNAANGFGINYHQAPTAQNRGDFEQSSFTSPGPSTADDLQIPEVDIQLKSLKALLLKLVN